MDGAVLVGGYPRIQYHTGIFNTVHSLFRCSKLVLSRVDRLRAGY